MKNQKKGGNVRLKYILLIFLAAVLIIFLVAISPKINMFATKEFTDSFNLHLEIPPDYKTVAPKDTIWFTIKVLNLANQERIDVTLRYEILDKDKKPLVSKSETVAVETQASFVKNLKIPEDAPKGEYTLSTKLIYNNEELAIGEESFNINPNLDDKSPYIILILVALIILITIIIIFLYPKIRKINEKNKIKSQIHKIIKNRIKNQNK